jgi:hypothetical protein
MNFKGLKYGEFITALERMPADEPVKFDFVHFGPTRINSYRGFYEDAALGYQRPDDSDYEFPTVEELVRRLTSVLGHVFEGWKGGNGRPIRLESSLWVANPGETGDTVIVDVQNLTYVTIITRSEEEKSS